MALRNSSLEKLVTLLVLGCFLQWSAVSGCDVKDRLVRDLTERYRTSVEPDNSVLKSGLSPVCVREDKGTNEFIINAWEKFTWTDKRLSWSPADYNGIETIRLPSKLIWLPDFKLYNSLSPFEERDETNVVIRKDGTVLWVPTVRYRVFCTKESDDNGISCQLKSGSWTYDSDTLPLQVDGAGIDLIGYMNTTCPLVVDSASATLQTKYYPCCKEPYSHIEYNISLKLNQP